MAPRPNGWNERFDGKRKCELIDRESLYSPGEAQVLVERWHGDYNTI